MNQDERWRRKVAAYLHDPPEKALILMRTPGGHEAGTVATICQEVFGEPRIPADLKEIVEFADHYAAAADRATWPRNVSECVRFPDEPVLVHPLAGTRYRLNPLQDLEANTAQRIGTTHLRSLVARRADGIDWRGTALRLWRLAPEPPQDAKEENGEQRLGELWPHLPADTRVPDHSIFEHLRLASAIAGAFPRPALLLMSLGPVQAFIAQARSTSDLWAGSHLLSRLAWEAMKPLCKEYGPDAVLFPDLWGVPLCDAWLHKEGLPIENSPLRKRTSTDLHPLFFASIPNRFAAVVPEEELDRLVASVREHVSRWIGERAEDAWREILKAADLAGDGPVGGHAREQIRRQLAEFPEMSWTSVSLRKSEHELRCSLEKFLGGGEPAAFRTAAYAMASGRVRVDGVEFFAPTEGHRYPAAYHLGSLAATAVKSVRPFSSDEQRGYRCSVCGEREFLTHDETHLDKPRGREVEGDPWRVVAVKHPALVRGTEHLCALCTLKRAWGRLATREHDRILAEIHGGEGDTGKGSLRRFVVSTHAMALAPTLERLALGKGPREARESLWRLIDSEKADGQRAALPRRLARALRGDSADHERIRRIPSILDELSDEATEEAERKRQEILKALAQAAGGSRETYYALVMMDGDNMGAWLSGSARDGSGPGRPPLRERLHPRMAEAIGEIARQHERLAALLEEPSPVSPAYHSAVSRALNSFSLEVVPVVVEELSLGKVIYAGGDDVLAMAGVAGLLGMAHALRCAFSGLEMAARSEWDLLDDEGRARCRELGFECKNGYVRMSRGGRVTLHRMMGEKATASMGIVIAHHMTPLGTVVRELRAAERRAKSAGRDAVSVTLLKRAGSMGRFTCGWHLDASGAGEPPALVALSALVDAFAGTLSRGVAYDLPAWVAPLVASGDQSREQLGERIAAVAAHLMRRRGLPAERAGQLATLLASLVARERDRRQSTNALLEFDAGSFVADTLNLVEFLARSGRGASGEAR